MIHRAGCPACHRYTTHTNGRFDEHMDSFDAICAGSGLDAREAITRTIAEDIAQMVEELPTCDQPRRAVLTSRINVALRMMCKVHGLGTNKTKES